MKEGQERSVGLTVAGASALFAAYAAWRGRPAWAVGAAALATGLLVLALVAPARLRRPAAAWMRFAHALGWVNSRVLLGVFFVLVLVPLGLGLRAAGWDPLGRRQRAKASGWAPYPERRRDPRHYEKMY